MKKLILSEFYVLLVGTLFAWYNFSRELIGWLNAGNCSIGCSGGDNPFITPCFYGAIFFTIAFMISFVLLIKVKKTDNLKT